MKYPILFTLIFVLLTSSLFSQENPKKINANFIQEDIKLDGVLDEKIWQEAIPISDFWQFFPLDSVQANYQTEVKIVYDETTLYVGIHAKSSGEDYVVSTLRRDFRGTTNDNITLLFDTFNDGTNAFAFGVTPYGVQREILISQGGAVREGFNRTWDVKWKAESKMFEDYYSVEIAIPFTSIKFEEGGSRWGFRAYRWNLQANEQSTWIKVPQNQFLANLAFMGELNFEKPLGKSRTPIALVPYINTFSQKDFEGDDSDNNIKIGGDAKFAIGNGMNLDLTINPDFSNVEVDDIITNLTRFEVSLPERRQFFIDNSDLFATFGSRRDAVPFFSRRIGIASDTAGNTVSNNILGGLRLSGKLNQNWRLGLLNIQTDEDPNNEIASNNNTMFALQRKVFSRSNIGIFMVNRETFNDYDFLEKENKFNRVIGLDYNLASKNSVWQGKFFVHKSFQPDDTKGNISSQTFLIYNTRRWRLALDFVYVDEDFTSDLGFIPRKDIFKNGINVAYTFYPKSGILNKHTFRYLGLNFWRPNLDFKKSDHNYRLFWNAEFKNQARLDFTYSNQFIFLTDDFDPTSSDDGIPLPGNTDYSFNQFSIEYRSNQAQRLTYNINSTIGQFFNGNRYSIRGRLGVRMQPWAEISLALNYDRIQLPDPHPSADLWLASPRVDITFSKSLFWTTIMQYRKQSENLGFNSRVQWRFAPLSDLYLVYNDNYLTTDFSPRFRSINLKLSYWLNL